MKGYKAFDKDLKCREMQYEVGVKYEISASPVLCGKGYHFCQNLIDVYNYYDKSSNTRICEVEALGEVKTEGDKSVTNKIKIIRELDDKEKLEVWIKRNNSGDRNSGHYNSGDSNSGYYNSGHRNSGHYNSGYYNSGDSNSGYYNSGDSNSGYYNSGHRNSGHYNSGYYNSGHRNSGHYNSGHYNSGYFNTNSPKVRLFNIDSNLDFNDPLIQKINNIIYNNWKPFLTWVLQENMTEEEKIKFPHYKTTLGYLKKEEYSYKKSWERMWTKLSTEDREAFTSLPNFDSKIFEEITGVNVELDNKIEVEYNGRKIKIDLDKAKELGLIE